jgi:hypothetical protein
MQRGAQLDPSGRFHSVSRSSQRCLRGGPRAQSTASIGEERRNAHEAALSASADTAAPLKKSSGG